jgi:hypothetical protein
MFSYAAPAAQVPERHPLRAMGAMVDQATMPGSPADHLRAVRGMCRRMSSWHR